MNYLLIAGLFLLGVFIGFVWDQIRLHRKKRKGGEPIGIAERAYFGILTEKDKNFLHSLKTKQEVNKHGTGD